MAEFTADLRLNSVLARIQETNAEADDLLRVWTERRRRAWQGVLTRPRRASEGKGKHNLHRLDTAYVRQHIVVPHDMNCYCLYAE